MSVIHINYQFHFQHNILLLKLFGFWKLDGNIKFKKLYKLYTALCITFWIIFLVSQYKFMYEKIDNVEDFTDLMYVIGK